MSAFNDLVYTGGKIDTPGLYSRVPISRYHDDLCVGPSISSSGLRKIFNESPAHYYYASHLNPNQPKDDPEKIKKEKEAFILGRAVHHVILGEPFFAKLFVVQPDEITVKARTYAWNNNRTECRQWHFSQRQMGKTVLTQNQVDRIRGMAFALGRHPLVQQGVLNGRIERSIVWRDAHTGIWLKSRPDVIPRDSADFVDLKITRSIQYESLVRSIGDFGYAQQAALAIEGCRKALGLEAASFTFCFIEHEPPHCVRFVQLKEHEIVRGAKANRKAMRIFADCLKNKEWPGPGSITVEWIELSQRQQDRIDAELVGETE